MYAFSPQAPSCSCLPLLQPDYLPAFQVPQAIVRLAVPLREACPFFDQVANQTPTALLKDGYQQRNQAATTSAQSSLARLFIQMLMSLKNSPIPSRQQVRSRSTRNPTTSGRIAIIRHIKNIVEIPRAHRRAMHRNWCLGLGRA